MAAVWHGSGRVTWLVVITLGALVYAALLGLYMWADREWRRVREESERAQRGECTCTRHRLCAVCLAELRGEQAA